MPDIPASSPAHFNQLSEALRAMQEGCCFSFKQIPWCRTFPGGFLTKSFSTYVFIQQINCQISSSQTHRRGLYVQLMNENAFLFVCIKIIIIKMLQWKKIFVFFFGLWIFIGTLKSYPLSYSEALLLSNMLLIGWQGMFCLLAGSVLCDCKAPPGFMVILTVTLLMI